MPLFRRRQSLHRRLADAAGLSLDDTARTPAPAATPPGWDGEQRGEPGIHGVARARRWDAVATTTAPDVPGESVHFVVLADGSIVAEEDVPADAVALLAAPLEGRLEPPYRAEGVRRGGSEWGIAARAVTVVREPALEGDDAELVVTSAERTLTVDGERRVARAPALEAAGAREALAFVVRATRLVDDLWEIEASAL